MRLKAAKKAGRWRTLPSRRLLFRKVDVTFAGVSGHHLNVVTFIISFISIISKQHLLYFTSYRLLKPSSLAKSLFYIPEIPWSYSTVLAHFEYARIFLHFLTCDRIEIEHPNGEQFSQTFTRCKIDLVSACVFGVRHSTVLNVLCQLRSSVNTVVSPKSVTWVLRSGIQGSGITPLRLTKNDGLFWKGLWKSLNFYSKIKQLCRVYNRGYYATMTYKRTYDL